MTATASAPPATRPDPRRWKALAVVLVGQLVILVDATIVNVAVPSIESGLHASYSSVEWVISGYALSYGLLLVTGGRLGDLYGRRRLFLLGVAGFVAASAACGLATSPAELIAFRVAQGAMAALLQPQIIATAQVSFAGHERARAFALVGAVSGVATAIGPLAGGALIATHLTAQMWRPIFLVNVPVGVATIVAGLVFLRESRSPRDGLDLVGVALSSAALFLVTFGLVQGQAAGWPWWIFACLAGAAPALAAFVAWEAARVRRGKPCLIRLELFRSRSFSAGLAVGLLYFAGFTSLFFSLSLYLQLGLGYSALRAGLAIVPFSAASFVGSASTSTPFIARLGRRSLMIGLVAFLVGLGGLVALVHSDHQDPPDRQLAITLLVAGVGSGLVVAPLIGITLAGVPAKVAGGAAGVLSTGQRLGTALGIAAVGTVLFASLAGGAPTAAAKSQPRLRAELRLANLPAGATAEATSRFERCFVAQARSSDPASIPPGCSHPSGSTAVDAAFSSASRSALEHDFSSGLIDATWINLAAMVATLGLVLGLPKRSAFP